MIIGVAALKRCPAVMMLDQAGHVHSLAKVPVHMHRLHKLSRRMIDQLLLLWKKFPHEPCNCIMRRRPLVVLVIQDVGSAVLLIQLTGRPCLRVLALSVTGLFSSVNV